MMHNILPMDAVVFRRPWKKTAPIDGSFLQSRLLFEGDASALVPTDVALCHAAADCLILSTRLL
jgi:hypothetical protein